MKDLKDKVCVITGAGKGFGRDMASVFFENDSQIALATRSLEDVESLTKEYAGYEDRVLIERADLSNSEEVFLFRDKVFNKFGGADILINNAGMRFRRHFFEISPDDIEMVMKNNFLSIFWMCQAFLPDMVEKKYGKVINMTSVIGVLGLEDLSAYISSKAAIVGLTKALSVDFAKFNVNINAIAPGFCKTSYFDNFMAHDHGLYPFTIDRTPARRWGESKEIANACLFLGSDMSSYVNGEVLNVDGGWSAW